MHLVFSACRHGAGTRADWPYFARWHYRSHTLGPVRRVTLLWHEDRPVGICVFAAPARSLRLRNQLFGLRQTSDRLFLQRLNGQLWVLARVVIHPTYRGAGLASAFVRTSCQGCPVPWIETLTAMGHLHPFFEKAGFRRIGVIRKNTRLSRAWPPPPLRRRLSDNGNAPQKHPRRTRLLRVRQPPPFSLHPP